MEKTGLTVGKFCVAYFEVKDFERVRNAQRQAKLATHKERRARTGLLYVNLKKIPRSLKFNKKKKKVYNCFPYWNHNYHSMSYNLILTWKKLEITTSYMSAKFHRDMSTVAEVMTSKQLNGNSTHDGHTTGTLLSFILWGDGCVQILWALGDGSLIFTSAVFHCLAVAIRPWEVTY